ncbi:MAG: branched-chain amino acid aminotransferase [Neomegalonema sp.]|nr:branched-chain amino acid aminotransferase [Neomegalonema sp.]
MAAADKIWTYFEGKWIEGDAAVIRAADHGAWLGTLVFDGARAFEGVTPDLEAHCTRVNASARAMGMKPTLTAEEMIAITHQGLAKIGSDCAVYIRPMYWSRDPAPGLIPPDPDSTAFCMCLEALAMPASDATLRLASTRYRRPQLENAVVNAKAACLYPNNARMIREARAQGFDNAIVLDALGNVAETGTSNLFMVRDGETLTPIANGCFLAGVTRARIMSLLQQAGRPVREAVLTMEDFRGADEVFATGNYSKVTPVTAINDTHFAPGPIAAEARRLYWEWARQ